MRRKSLYLKPFMHCDRESLDIDYFNLLDEESQKWLQRWAENEYNAYFRNDGKDIITDPKERTAADTKKKYRKFTSEVQNTTRYNGESESSEDDNTLFGTQVLVLKEKKKKFKKIK